MGSVAEGEGAAGAGTAASVDAADVGVVGAGDEGVAGVGRVFPILDCVCGTPCQQMTSQCWATPHHEQNPRQSKNSMELVSVNQCQQKLKGKCLPSRELS